jgi:hypothetical protein
MSSGCIRLTNEDVKDLFDRVKIGAKVIVLPMTREAKVPTHQARNSDDAQIASYAPAEPGAAAARAWNGIRPSGLY